MKRRVPGTYTFTARGEFFANTMRAFPPSSPNRELYTALKAAVQKRRHKQSHISLTYINTRTHARTRVNHASAL